MANEEEHKKIEECVLESGSALRSPQNQDKEEPDVHKRLLYPTEHPLGKMRYNPHGSRRPIDEISGRDSFAAPRRNFNDLEFSEALQYLYMVKEEFHSDPLIYDNFLDIMKDYKHGKMNASGVVKAITALFSSKPHLIRQFNEFLPKEARSEPRIEQRVETRIEQRIEPRNELRMDQRIVEEQNYLPRRGPPSFVRNNRTIPQPTIKAETPEDYQRQKMASNYIQKVKTRLLHRPESYRAFIDVIRSHQSAKMPIDKVLSKLKVILWEYPDLIEEFREFMPKKPVEPVENLNTREENEILSKIKIRLKELNCYNDFLKCINLYNQNLIGGREFVYIVKPLIRNEEYLESLCQYIGYKQAEIPPHSLTNIMQYKRVGSYRILPEKYQECEGWDALSQEVLNRVCVGCPTYSSETGNFVSLKRSCFEETMFRIEDERYESELLIGRAESLIMALELVYSKIKNSGVSEVAMSEIDMPAALVDETLRCIYSERAGDILEGLLFKPQIAIPVVLKRLYQASKKWREEMRDKCKIWREVTLKNHYRALDMAGICFRSSEKRILSNKSFAKEAEKGIHISVKDKIIFDDVLKIYEWFNTSNEDSKEVELLLVDIISVLKSGEWTMYLGITGYSLFRAILMAYERLCDLKANLVDERLNPVAVEMNLVENVKSGGRYFDILLLIQDFLEHEIDAGVFEDKLRFLSNCRGYKLCNIDKIVFKISAFANKIVDSKNIKDFIEHACDASRTQAEDLQGESAIFKLVKSGENINIELCQVAECDSEGDESLVKTPVFLMRTKKKECISIFVKRGAQCKIGGKGFKYIENTEDFCIRKGLSRENK
ncbi:Paired amphipathic helix protein Sin3b [Astathelohania contejeani]|uniref:Paired amphipathic helix protein Sin3b n=1 Tax=Astathelohania contejeani TaxID=164912 RepID=A0ABQ7HYJ8_9MICR|nr:Paired amphipathic helix protein Sin3b [Thelohania contejeani]